MKRNQVNDFTILIPTNFNMGTTDYMINIYTNLRDLYKKLVGYKHKYNDMNGKTIYIPNCDTFAKKFDHKHYVLKVFGHLKYVIKTNLRTGRTTKVSIEKFRSTDIKLNNKDVEDYVKKTKVGTGFMLGVKEEHDDVINV